MESDRPNDQPQAPRQSPARRGSIGGSQSSLTQTESSGPGGLERAGGSGTGTDSVLDALIDLLSSPSRTWRHLKRILDSTQTEQASVAPATLPRPGPRSDVSPRVRALPRPNLAGSRVFSAERVRLLLYVSALALALIGNSALLGPPGISRTPENTLNIGAPYLAMAICVWLLAELYGHRQELTAGWRQFDRIARAKWIIRALPGLMLIAALSSLADSMTATPTTSSGHLLDAVFRFLAGLGLWIAIEFVARRPRERDSAPTHAARSPEKIKGDAAETLPYRTPLALRISRGRLALVPILAVSSILVWINTGGNQIAPQVILLWIVSSLLWATLFAPAGWNLWEFLSDKIDLWRRIRWREQRWAIVAFVLILVLGISFRVTELDAIPPEMTSDHVEKIRDGYRVSQGDYKIFFPNNGGREPLQMYLLAAAANLPGLGFDLFTLKVIAVVESLLTLPVLFWMGLELTGGSRKRYNFTLALLLTALVAVSYWHVIITRQALRIPLTPLVTALLLIYLARAMRHNRRSDFVKAGLILGFGLYMYQAMRMLPVLVIAGLATALLLRRIDWRERVRYLLHLAVLVFVSFVVFLPMLHYSIEDPSHFWMRTTTRILGDDLGFATMEQAEAALRANVSVFMNNVRNALLMFNWRGDIGWFNGAPQHPVLDIMTGSFLILGVAAWLVRMLKTRDPVTWFMPIVILIMLLPTILSLAHPDANPSNSRALGAAPAIYLVAALPIAILAQQLQRAFAGRRGKRLAVLICVGIVLFANQRNAETYFEGYADAYIGPSFPHSQAGEILKGFIESDGAPGNAFSVGFPFWWDYRALGIVAGYPMWPNDGWPIERLPEKLAGALRRADEFRLLPERDLLFFHNVNDQDTKARLNEWFPNGRELVVQSYHPEDQFVLYRVPALGQSGWETFVATQLGHGR